MTLKTLIRTGGSIHLKAVRLETPKITGATRERVRVVNQALHKVKSHGRIQEEARVAIKEKKGIAAIIPTSLRQVHARIGAANKPAPVVLRAMQAIRKIHL